MAEFGVKKKGEANKLGKHALPTGSARKPVSNVTSTWPVLI